MKYFAIVLTLLTLTISFSSKNSYAGPPLTNLEGVGGIAFNPLAWLADSGEKDSYFKLGETDFAAKPRTGVWYVSLDDVKVDWTSIGITDTFFKRFELSYSYQAISQDNATSKHKNNIGGKLLILPENSFGLKYAPAFSVGAIYKKSSDKLPGFDDSGADFYAVATKLVTELPKPVLFSAGILSTKSLVTGVFGFDEDTKQTFFGNIDVIPLSNFIVGFEFKQGAEFDDFKNADYWNAHLAYLAGKNLSLILAYVDAGDNESTKAVGLGNGVVLSSQYAF